MRDPRIVHQNIEPTCLFQNLVNQPHPICWLTQICRKSPESASGSANELFQFRPFSRTTDADNIGPGFGQAQCHRLPQPPGGPCDQSNSSVQFE